MRIAIDLDNTITEYPDHQKSKTIELEAGNLTFTGTSN